MDFGPRPCRFGAPAIGYPTEGERLFPAQFQPPYANLLIEAMNPVETSRRILAATTRIALVGASDRPERDSHRVMQYLLRQGFQVFPVNPNVTEVLGQACAGRLADLPVPIDTVLCFRRSEYIEPLAEETIAAGAKHLWMQFGVVNERAAQKVRDAGLLVVMDRCMMLDHRRFATLAK